MIYPLRILASVLLLSSLFMMGYGFTQSGTIAASRASSQLNMAEGDISRSEFITKSAAVGGTVAASGLWTPSVFAATEKRKAWEKVELPSGATLFDIDFDTKNPDHGFLVGAKGTFLETFNGGKSWGVRTFSNLDEDEEINYRFEKVSFLDGEAWIIGKPPILLHTRDDGKSWERIPLSPKLPGEPSGIIATGNEQAEMTTSTGAIYYTGNQARNWKAQLKETIDATLNRVSSSGVSGASFFSGTINDCKRDVNGNYLAVSSRGNFYLTWVPGQDFWIPHNRGTPRRIQNMGFIQDDIKNGVWMSLNGGLLQLTEPGQEINGINDAKFKDAKIKSGGYGILDCTWKDEKEVWAVGGGGTMYYSRDGGNEFKFDSSADKIPGNLYTCKFFGPNKGFVLGSDGVLLRYAAGDA
mmetsp:Transcript_39192/g.61225  ORF Transcript_39192/g.61225 Transcript_39192/m.61225 type:complete len:411 (+) Transcript_39192:104-1336(+)